MNIADYVAAGILIISGAHGWYIGFILSFFNIAGYFIAAFIAKMYYKEAAFWISEYTQIDERIRQFIKEKLQTHAGSVLENEVPGTSELMSEMPESIQERFIDKWPSALTSGMENLTDQMADLILNIIGMTILFIVALIIIKILVAILNILAKAPGLKEINRGGGLLLGLVKGMLVILIILAILTPYIGTHPDHILTETLLNSRFGSWLYNHNLLFWWLKDYLLTGLQFAEGIR